MRMWRTSVATVVCARTQALTVAFMQRVPAYDPAWDAKVPERSALEQELGKVRWPNVAGCARTKQRRAYAFCLPPAQHLQAPHTWLEA